MAAKAKGRAGGEERLARGRQRKEAIFPAAGPRPGLPGGYAQVLGEIKRRIQTERLRTVMAANSAMVLLYWDIGKGIVEKQHVLGWGESVVMKTMASSWSGSPTAMVVARPACPKMLGPVWFAKPNQWSLARAGPTPSNGAGKTP